MEKMTEKLPAKGIFEARIFRHGKLIEAIHDDNLIVNKARIQMSRLAAGEVAGRHITKIAFGTNRTDPMPADAVITNQFVKNITGYVFPDDGQVCFNWELLVTENNGMAILEFGLLTEDGLLFARKTRTNPIHKAADISIEGQWTIIF